MQPMVNSAQQSSNWNCMLRPHHIGGWTPSIVKGADIEQVWGSLWESPRKLWWWECKTSRGKRGTQTHDVGLQFPTFLLDYNYEAFGEVSGCHNKSKWALCSPGWYTGPVQIQYDRSDPGIQTCPHRRSGTWNGTHMRIHQATHLWLVSSLVHDLWVPSFCNGVHFL